MPVKEAEDGFLFALHFTHRRNISGVLPVDGGAALLKARVAGRVEKMTNFFLGTFLRMHLKHSSLISHF